MARHDDSFETGEVVDLDLRYLARLEAQIGADCVAELLADGLVEVTDRLEAVVQRAHENNRDAVARIAHDLTSIAGHIGLSDLSRKAAACQRTLREPARVGELPQTVAPVVAAGHS